jgi:hypothetical protein
MAVANKEVLSLKLLQLGLSSVQIEEALNLIAELFQKHRSSFIFPTIIYDGMIYADDLEEYLRLYTHILGTRRIGIYTTIIESLRRSNPEIWGFLPKMEEIVIDEKGQSIMSVIDNEISTSEKIDRGQARKIPVAECYAVICRSQSGYTDLYDQRCDLIRLFLEILAPETLEEYTPSQEYIEEVYCFPREA